MSSWRRRRRHCRARPRVPSRRHRRRCRHRGCWRSIVVVMAVVWYCCARPRVPSRRRHRLWCCRCHRGVTAGSSLSSSSWRWRRHCHARPRVPSRRCGVVVVIVAVVVVCQCHRGGGVVIIEAVVVVVASLGCRQLEFHAGVVVGLLSSGEQKRSGTCVGVRSRALGEAVKFSVGILMVVYIDGYLVELTQRRQSTVRLFVLSY